MSVGYLSSNGFMSIHLSYAVNEHQDLRRKYADECNERRQLYNKVLELKGTNYKSLTVDSVISVLLSL